MSSEAGRDPAIGSILNYNGRTSAGFNEESGLCKVIRKCDKNEDCWVVKMIVSKKTYSAPSSRLSNPEVAGRGHRKRTSLTQSDQDSNASDTSSAPSSPSSACSSNAGKRQKTKLLASLNKLSAGAGNKRALEVVGATVHCNSTVTSESPEVVTSNVKLLPSKQKRAKSNVLPANTVASVGKCAELKAQSKKPAPALEEVAVDAVDWRALSETVKPPSPLWQLIPISDPQDRKINDCGVDEGVIKADKSGILWPCVDDEVKVIFDYQHWRAGRVVAYNTADKIVSVLFYDDGMNMDFCFPHRDLVLYKTNKSGGCCDRISQRNGGKPIYTSQSTAIELSLEQVAQDPLSLLYVQFCEDFNERGEYWGTIVDVTFPETIDVKRIIFTILWDDGFEGPRPFPKLFNHLEGNRKMERLGLNGRPEKRAREVGHKTLEDLTLMLQSREKAKTAALHSQQCVSKSKTPATTRKCPDGSSLSAEKEKENVSDLLDSGAHGSRNTTATATIKKKPVSISKATSTNAKNGAVGAQKSVRKSPNEVLTNRSATSCSSTSTSQASIPPPSLSSSPSTTVSSGSKCARNGVNTATNNQMTSSVQTIEKCNTAAGGLLTLLGQSCRAVLVTSALSENHSVKTLNCAQMRFNTLSKALDVATPFKDDIAAAISNLSVVKHFLESQQRRSPVKSVTGASKNNSCRGDDESRKNLMPAVVSLRKVSRLLTNGGVVTADDRIVEDALGMSQKALEALETAIAMSESREKKTFGTAIKNLARALGADCPDMGIDSDGDQSVLLSQTTSTAASTAVKSCLERWRASSSSSLSTSTSSATVPPPPLTLHPKWKPLPTNRGCQSYSNMLSQISDSKAPLAAIRATLACSLSGHSGKVSNTTIRGSVQSALETARKLLSACDMKNDRTREVEDEEDGEEGDGDEDHISEMCAKATEVSTALEQLRAQRNRMQSATPGGGAGTPMAINWTPTNEQISDAIQMATTAISGLHTSLLNASQDTQCSKYSRLYSKSLQCCSEVLQFADEAIAINVRTNAHEIAGIAPTSSTNSTESESTSSSSLSSSSSSGSSILSDVEASLQCVIHKAMKLVHVHAFFTHRCAESQYLPHAPTNDNTNSVYQISTSTAITATAGASHSYKALIGAAGIVNTLGNLLIRRNKERQEQEQHHGSANGYGAGNVNQDDRNEYVSDEYWRSMLFSENSKKSSSNSSSSDSSCIPQSQLYPIKDITSTTATGSTSATVSACECSDALSLAWMLSCPRSATCLNKAMGSETLRLHLLSAVMAERAARVNKSQGSSELSVDREQGKRKRVLPISSSSIITVGGGAGSSLEKIEKAEGVLCTHALLADMARLTAQCAL